MKDFIAFLAVSLCSLASAQEGHFLPYKVSPDLHEVVNLKAFARTDPISKAAVSVLAKNLFAVVAGDNYQLYESYAENDYDNIPSFITVDSALHTYHVFYDALLRQIEQTVLLAHLKRLTLSMTEQSIIQWKALDDPAAKDAALKNIAYFAVSQQLLGEPTPNIPAEADALAKSEMALVSAQSGMETSPIFGTRVDYSLFTVRGHYTRTEMLKKYFQSMTWLGMPFPLAKEDGSPNPGAIRQAVLVSRALATNGIMADWNAIYEPTTLFVGPSNMYTPGELGQAISASLGDTSTPSEAKFGDFLKKLTSIRQPAIVSKISDTGMANAVQFTFMGRRFIPDSMIFNKLTGEQRLMPAGLDVMAVFGSSEAARLLDSNPRQFNPNGWSGYQGTRAQLKTDFATADPNLWSSNLYWGWLDVLRSYVQQVPAGYPSSMKGVAWADKKLSTALGSWTELRHDTILYGEQSGAEAGDERPPKVFVPQFVEPAPQTFSRLSALFQQTTQELIQRKMISKDAADHAAAFQGTLTFLSAIAEKEVAGQPVTKAEYQRIRDIEEEFSDPINTMLRYGTNIQNLSQDDLDMSLVADVHTASDVALEEAIGHGDDLYVVMPFNGKLYLARGCVFSYYEFAQPISHRLTDAEWKQTVRDGKTPARPFWTSGFFVPTPSDNQG